VGNLTGILLCYLGVQAGHIFVYSSRIRRICIHWVIWGIICGGLGLILSKGGHSAGWIPINKNLWSLTFVLTLAGLGYLILTVLYFLVDVRQWFTGAPFLWLGMNSIVIYIGHDRFAYSFPVQWEVNSSHAEQLAVHLWGSFFWSLAAGFMYYNGFFIAI
jgi:heparan-alpha-glucosaminide N-acetyltransferase